MDRLIRADGLEVARGLPDGSLDFVYLDPPFGAGRTHATLRGRGNRGALAGRRAYADPGTDGAPSPWLTALLGEMPRLLRPGGAIILHLDWRTVHRAKVLLDDLLGAENFLNEIIWHYATGGIPGRWFARKHDTLLYYRNGGEHHFERMTIKKYLAHRMSRRGLPEYRDEGGWYRYRSLDDVWEIPWLTQDAKERTGYPSQKPEALLERILRATTRVGDLVADFCVGSGTTAAVARRLGRAWLAVDREPLAIDVTRARLDAMTMRAPMLAGLGDEPLRAYQFEDRLEPSLAPGKELP
ncbi:MAG: site-specific DNA-methyltransferase [Candidatus Eisenbacteria bacterium]|nr:site-specific DNA-methyltransferase [Candidatus Eisenbacteria bacterium]